MPYQIKLLIVMHISDKVGSKLIIVGTISADT